MNTGNKTQKILLAQLPFWDPLIPPLGIACLRAFLESHQYQVKILDLNVEKKFKELGSKYFHLLETLIPLEKRGNFHNIGHEVLRNHMMAHLHYRDESEYTELVNLIIGKTFFVQVEIGPIKELNKLLEVFYRELEHYFLALLKKEEPTVLGLSVYKGTLAASLFIFKRVKEIYPLVKTVMGGGIFADQLAVHSPDMEFFLAKTPYIDHLIIGEGEKLFLQLLQGKLPEHQRVYTLSDIDGETLDLASSDIPDYQDLEPGLYPQMASYVSRSCPFQCSFCSETLQWGKYRKKSAVQVAEELRQLVKRYHYQLFLLGDSLLNPVIHDLALALSKEKTAIYYDGYLRADKHVGDTGETLLWRRSGFYRARMGVESGSQHVLDMMGKRLTVDQIKAAISCLAAVGIKTTTYWVIGHPGETEADFQQTLDLLEKLKDDIYEADCNPFNFFPSGQVNSWQWKDKYMSLYPPSAVKMLLIQTWIVKGEPTREETYRRVSRFMAHCRKLGIPNPYSMQEIYQADERWKRLKRNAVPTMLEFKKKGSIIDECKQGQELHVARNKQQYNLDFSF
jgi:radical SAM superfamily enzyme YgiQ (UPF0313 family)